MPIWLRNVVADERFDENSSIMWHLLYSIFWLSENVDKSIQRFLFALMSCFHMSQPSGHFGTYLIKITSFVRYLGNRLILFNLVPDVWGEHTSVWNALQVYCLLFSMILGYTYSWIALLVANWKLYRGRWWIRHCYWFAASKLHKRHHCFR